MFLYLDLEKGVGQIPSTGTEPQSGRAARQAYVESFDNQYGGVLSGHTTPDNPKQGASWSSGPTVEDELDQIQDENNQRAQEAGLVPAPKKEEMAKSLAILGDLNTQLREMYQAYVPTDQERDFLLSKGFDPKKVSMGAVRIAGPLRHEFNVWLHEQLHKSLESLVGKL